MRDWSPELVAEAAGVRLVRPASRLTDDPPGPLRVTIDSREVQPGDLFVGLKGRNVDGGRYTDAALAAGAWEDRHGEQDRPRDRRVLQYAIHWLLRRFAPAKRPKLLVTVMVDEPQGEIYGSDVAAPAFREIMRFALPYLGIAPG